MGESTRIEAKVVSVGEGGCMLRTASQIPTDGPIHLSFMLAGSGVVVESLATVRWWRKTPEGEREVGLQFAAPHPGVASYIEKRLAMRKALEKAF